MQQTLFALDLPKNTNKKESVDITTTILYFSKPELRDFRRLTKLGMRKMYPDTYRDENFADFLLTLLKQYNEE